MGWHSLGVARAVDEDVYHTALRRDLVGPHLSWRRLDVVETTGSTNADLLARHSAGEDIDGAVLIAEHQSAGRGRNGRAWSTPARSQIALSVGVAARGVPPAAWGWIPLMTGVAVVDAVRANTGVDAKLKWPNDILVNERKLAGILAEVAAPDPVIVVGLGLNVTLTEDEAPDQRATSLSILGSTMLDRSALLGSVLAELSVRIDRWRTAGGPDALLVEDYRRLSSTLGTRVRAILPGNREIVGIATDLDKSGQLSIDTGAQTVTVSAGDITHLRNARD
jgi:BirA family biotin operon repressor/biotin-[acetyl-CoA-carboxylase] ligase